MKLFFTTIAALLSVSNSVPIDFGKDDIIPKPIQAKASRVLEKAAKNGMGRLQQQLDDHGIMMDLAKTVNTFEPMAQDFVQNVGTTAQQVQASGKTQNVMQNVQRVIGAVKENDKMTFGAFLNQATAILAKKAREIENKEVQNVANEGLNVFVKAVSDKVGDNINMNVGQLITATKNELKNQFKQKGIPTNKQQGNRMLNKALNNLNDRV